MRPTNCLLILILISTVLYSTEAIPIDNGVVGQPEVLCGTDTISISFHTQRPFVGRIFVKGYAYQRDCVVTGSAITRQTFSLSFSQCGIRRTRQINGITVGTTLIISFHQFFLTKVDRAYRVHCFYMEATKTVTQDIGVSMLTTQDVSYQVPMPICRYDILSGGPNGAPVKYARIGEKVYHKWTCISDTDDIFCIRVHTCFVDDGQGGQPIEVLDANGCAVDIHILQDLDYTSDLMAGQEAHVFKFADRPGLYFNCQVEIRLKDSNFGCANVIPNCGQGTFQTTTPQYTERQRQQRQRQQRDLRQRPLANFDIPQSALTVFDIEAASPPETELEETNTILPNTPFSESDALSKKICLSPERFAGLAISLAALCVISIAFISVGLLRHGFVTDFITTLKTSA